MLYLVVVLGPLEGFSFKDLVGRITARLVSIRIGHILNPHTLGIIADSVI